MIPLTIGPAFLSGSIYLCLARIVVVYGTDISRLSPRTYAIIFMCLDFISLLLQGTGGGIAATANTDSGSNAGRYIMIAGLAFQVLSLAIFMTLWLEYINRLRRARETSKNRDFANFRASSSKFKAFQYGKLFWITLVSKQVRTLMV